MRRRTYSAQCDSEQEVVYGALRLQDKTPRGWSICMGSASTMAHLRCSVSFFEVPVTH